MPEHDCLPPDVGATEFVTHMARISGLPRTAARERTAEVLRHVGLYEERYRQIGGYSTGMKQRVKLAQALAHDPKLLLLDEPTNGLDPTGRDEMLDLIKRTGTDFGISVVVASHLLGEIEQVCTFLLAIDAGHLLKAAPISTFTQRTPVVAVEVEEGADRLTAALTSRGFKASAGRAVRSPGPGERGPLRRGSRHRRRSWAAPGPGPAGAPPARGHLPRARARAGAGRRRCPMSAGNRLAASSPAGSIYDLGYRHYEGKRHGRWYAAWSLYVESLRGIWGFGRPMSAKAAPFILAGLYAFPALPAGLLVRDRPVESAAANTVQLFAYGNYFTALRFPADPLLRGPGARGGLPRPAIPGPVPLLHPGDGPRRLRARQARVARDGAVPGPDRADDRPLRRRRADEAGRVQRPSAASCRRRCRPSRPIC